MSNSAIHITHITTIREPGGVWCSSTRRAWRLLRRIDGFAITRRRKAAYVMKAQNGERDGVIKLAPACDGRERNGPLVAGRWGGHEEPLLQWRSQRPVATVERVVMRSLIVKEG